MAARDLIRLLQGADIPSTVAYTAADCAHDPHFRERGMVREETDSLIGDDILHPGIVPRFPEMPGRVRWTGPAIGQHTEEVLTELLGFSADELDELRRMGVV